MITSMSISAVQLLAQKICQAGYSITPLSGTPLWELQSASYTAMLDATNFVDGNDANSIVQRIACDSGTENAHGICTHDVALDNAKNMLANAIRADIHHARNIVRPSIDRCIEIINTRMKNHDIKTASVMSIVPDRFEAIWSSVFLLDMISPFKETMAKSIEVSPAIHPAASDETILGLLKTGSTRFDNELAEWVNEIGASFVIDTYNRYLLSPEHRPDSSFSMGDINSLMTLDAMGRKRALIIHIMANRLQKEVMEGISMRLGAYEIMMAEIYSQTGRILNRILEKRERAIQLNTVVIQWPVTGSEYATAPNEFTDLTVNADVYDKWLNAGGTPEALLGAAISDMQPDYDVLLEKREEYERMWNNRMLLVNAQNEARRFSVMADSIQYAVSKEIADLTDEVSGGMDKANMQVALTACIRKLTNTCLSDLVGCLRDIVCDVIYPDTNAKDLLRRIDEIHRNNPRYTPREAAGVAYLEHVVRWLTTLLDIDKCK